MLQFPHNNREIGLFWLNKERRAFKQEHPSISQQIVTMMDKATNFKWRRTDETPDHSNTVNPSHCRILSFPT